MNHSEQITTEQIPEDIIALIQQKLDGTISEEDNAKLEAWVLETPSNAQAFVSWCELHSGLRNYHHSNKPAKLPARNRIRPATWGLLAASMILAVGGVLALQQGLYGEAKNSCMLPVAADSPDIVCATEHKPEVLLVNPSGAPQRPACPSPSVGLPLQAPPAPITARTSKLSFEASREGLEKRVSGSPSDQTRVSGQYKYRVKSGDSLWKVAKETLGDGRLSDDLAEANGLPVDGPLQVGQILTLPTDRERYDAIAHNPFQQVADHPLSTFSVDVDTASYAIARKYLQQQNSLPPASSVRIEEFINAFEYDYAPPSMLAAGESIGDRVPFATHQSIATCPWAEGHQLVRIGIKGVDLDLENRPAAHLTFLLDVSGSMQSHDKLPLVKHAMQRLLDQMGENDKISIVVYAGGSGVVIEGAGTHQMEQVREAIQSFQAGGSTAGAAGIRLAYEVAQRHYIKGGANRVILCTDGDFNVGVSSDGELVELLKKKANPDNKQGVYVSVCGFGSGNLNDSMMEKISNAGNGNYHYIADKREAEKVFVQSAGGTLVTIAKDVKLQVEFNPARVARYRLIGYENRILRDEDFKDDTVDAGDIGAGHCVTALYEIIPVGAVDAYGDQAELAVEITKTEQALASIEQALRVERISAEGAAALQKEQKLLQARLATLKQRQADAARTVDPLRYQSDRTPTREAQTGEWLTTKIRYKHPDAPAEQGTSRELVFPLKGESVAFDAADREFRFAASVAAFGMLLRQSPHAGSAQYDWVLQTARNAKGRDIYGDRQVFLDLIPRVSELSPAK